MINQPRLGLCTGALVAFVGGCGALTVAATSLSDNAPTSPKANVIQVLVMLGAGLTLLAVAVVLVGGFVAIVVVADAQRHRTSIPPEIVEPAAGDLPLGVDQADLLSSHRRSR